MAQTIRITPDKIVRAKYSEAFCLSIFGMPKMTVICGNCGGQFKTREYIPEKITREAIAHCPYCSMWNQTGLTLEN